MKNENKEENTPPVYPEECDGPIAAPDHHKVVFEDERVRITELRVKPGETVPVHTHRWPTINYVIKLSDFCSYDADGTLKLDSRIGNFQGKEGEAFCLPSFPPLHSVKNVGTIEMHAISVEVKD